MEKSMITIDEAKVICKIKEQKLLAEKFGRFEWGKYLEEDQFLDEKLQIFRILKLDEKQNQRVLDVGAGLGHFGSLCKHYNHEYVGTYFGRQSADLKALHINANLNTVECGIFPRHGKEIPTGQWDCIVMLRTTFELNAEWCVDDWHELVETCMLQLKSGGQLLIKSNLPIERKSKFGGLDTQCWQTMITAFKDETPLPCYSWATWHLIKD
jgi:SAM-dependent methyltransferase